MALSKVNPNFLNVSQVGGRRNLIINGAMQVAQRGTSVTGANSNGYYTCDRFRVQITLGTHTVEQSTDAPNGFSNSWKISCTTANASPSAGNYLLLNHFIEAQNLQGLAFGTSDAKPLTLSFWVKSNKTGNASFEIEQSDNSAKMAGYQYTINQANTWEYKTISIPADTAGVINNDTGQGLQLNWWLNGGTDFTSGSHNSTWTTFASGDTNPSNLGIGGSTSDYWQITGVQLEVGEIATPFEHHSYPEELALCRRYFLSEPEGQFLYSTFENGSGAYTYCYITGGFPVEMRANPSVEFQDVNSYLLPVGGSASSPTGDINDGLPTSGTPGALVARPGGLCRAQITTLPSGGNTMQRGNFHRNMVPGCLTFDAELPV